MIQANEIKVNNRFIRALDSSRDLEYDHDFVLTEEWIGKLFGDNISIALQDLHPIPLTPEILEKCGFKKLNNAWVPIDYSATDYLKWSFTIWDNKDGTYRYNSAEFIPELKYLHQLQNLYYALTGEELIYKP